VNEVSATTDQATTSRQARAEEQLPQLERDGQLGLRIRQYRQEQGLTLAALAGRVGVTRSFLSSVERGIVYPSILVLRTIAAALEVPVFMLFTAPESNGVVVRERERTIIRPPNSPVAYELLSPDLQHRIEMIIMRLDPGAESALGAHEGEEVSHLLRGQVVVEIGGVDYEMATGDTIYFNSGLPHRVRCTGEEEAVMVAAITPPRF
jgi:transcriptional regulator with XRE-family HTH domain